MIGNMAEDKEFDEKTGSGDSEEEEEDDEEVEANGKDDFDEDDAEFDDPEGFMDEITDEGNFVSFTTFGLRKDFSSQLHG